jgi:FdhE protein
MPLSPPLTVEQINKAARVLSDLRPAYASMLAFYAEVFTAQERAKSDIALDPIELPVETLEISQQNRSPLVAPSAFRIDNSSGERLLTHICDLVVAHATKIKASAEAVQGAVSEGRLKPPVLFADLLRDRDGNIHETAAEIGADHQALAFLAYNAIQPSLKLCGEQLAVYLDAEAVWPKGYCPVCGGAPALAVLGIEGQRELHCRFCHHGWRAPRIFCALCENTQKDELHYFFAEKEKDLRVDVCNHCKGYLKSVDSREASRPIFPPLEQIASLHLDIIAADKGFSADLDLNFES